MVKRKELEWTDNDGEKYKLTYSEKLMMEKIRWDKIKTAILLAILVTLLVGGMYAYGLVQRIDALDPITKIYQLGAVFL